MSIHEHLWALQTNLLSDFDPTEEMLVSLPPRTVPPELLKDLKQVEFVGYVQNPQYQRGGKRGQAASAVAAWRNQRLQPKEQRGDQ